MIHYYYTVVSKEYTYKVLLLYYSMIKHDESFRFYIICLNKDSRKLFESLGLSNAVLIDAEVLEAYDEELAAVKGKRSIKQYAWAVKPSAALYIFEKYSKVDHIIWLDGDTLFLSSPEPIYEEWGEYPVALTEEKFTGKYEHIAEIYGFYNTGFMGFRRSDTALKCLEYFRQKLMEWNYDEKEQYRWNDQLYVSDWPQRFENIEVIKNHGVNMTPFIFNRLLNEAEYSLSEKDGCLYMGEVRITLFHFYGFNYLNRHEFELCCYTDIYDQAEINKIYLPYIKGSVEMIDEIGKIDRGFYTEEPADRKNIRNYYYLDVGNCSSRSKTENMRKKGIHSIKRKALDYMNSYDRGK